MAKKIRLDFSKVEERSAYNTRQIPEGLYKAKVVDLRETEAQDGTAMLVYTLSPTDNAYKSRKFPYYCKLQQNQLWKLRDLLVAGGMSVPKKAQQVDPEKIVGSTIAIEVSDDSYNGEVRSTVTGTYSPDILDEDEDTSSEEDFDEEDFDEEDFDEEDFDEEDFDEEDFDEEDFDEEDFDEEEEEKPKAVKKKSTKKNK